MQESRWVGGSAARLNSSCALCPCISGGAQRALWGGAGPRGRRWDPEMRGWRGRGRRAGRRRGRRCGRQRRAAAPPRRARFQLPPPPGLRAPRLGPGGPEAKGAGAQGAQGLMGGRSRSAPRAHASAEGRCARRSGRPQSAEFIRSAGITRRERAVPRLKPAARAACGAPLKWDARTRASKRGPAPPLLRRHGRGGWLEPTQAAEPGRRASE